MPRWAELTAALAAHTLFRTVPFAEDSATCVDNGDPQGAPIFEPQSQRNVDPFGEIQGRIGLYRTFDKEKARDGQAGTLHQPLMAADSIANLAQRVLPADQFSEAGKFFDKFQHPGDSNLPGIWEYLAGNVYQHADG